jgi:excinuclease UvrABC nuclease subunit
MVSAVPRPGGLSAGPIGSRSQAQASAAVLREAFGLRSCRPARPVDDGSCLAGAVGRCRAPCRGGVHIDAYAAAVDAAGRWLRGDRLVDPTPKIEQRMRELGRHRRFEDAAALRDQLAALQRVAVTLARQRTAVARAGIVLAPDVDDRFVQAFACVWGSVVGRRRLPRTGDAALETAALVTTLEPALRTAPGPLSAERAEQARIVSGALVRAGPTTRPLAIDRFSVGQAAGRIAGLRASVPLRS